MRRIERLGRTASRIAGAVTDTPEFNVGIFALLLIFAWEILQAPLYSETADIPHAQVTKACLQATVGDALIMLIADCLWRRRSRRAQPLVDRGS